MPSLLHFRDEFPIGRIENGLIRQNACFSALQLKKAISGANLKALQHIVDGTASFFDFDFVSLEQRHHDICIHIPRLVLFKIRVSESGNVMRNISRHNAAKVLRHTLPLKSVVRVQRSHRDAVSIDAARRKSATRLIWETELGDVEVALDV